jgi:hypothetical protein
MLFPMPMHLLESVVLAGALFAAVTIAALCGLGLVVWFAGGAIHSRSRLN